MGIEKGACLQNMEYLIFIAKHVIPLRGDGDTDTTDLAQGDDADVNKIEVPSTAPSDAPIYGAPGLEFEGLPSSPPVGLQPPIGLQPPVGLQPSDFEISPSVAPSDAPIYGAPGLEFERPPSVA